MFRIFPAIPLLFVLPALPAIAAPGEEEASIQEVVVFGRAQQQIGTARSASEGMVGYADIRLPPLLRVGEMAEVVPGMVATQHSGTGKANQYYLRGLNLDHGSDFAAHIDGVPLNMRTHGHGQGYLDLNFLIPELVETSTYRKGPYFASDGDFASAGSVRFSLYERLPESIFRMTTGEHGYHNGLLAGSADIGAGVLTGAVDANFYDGPWDHQEDLEQYKFYLGYAFDLAGGRARVAAQGYDGDWHSTDQIPLRAVESGMISRLGSLDDDIGGGTKRTAVSSEIDFNHWRAGAYLIDYEFSLFHNFTFLLDDPGAGDEFEQTDDRRIQGAWVNGETMSSLLGLPATWRWGSDLRFDAIDEVGLYKTASRQRLKTNRRDAVDELSLGSFGEVEIFLNERLRSSIGLRADYYDFEVSALRSAHSGAGDAGLLSPKFNLAYRLADNLEAYASWGRGFHSNDVRGATYRGAPDAVAPGLAREVLPGSEGAELGLRIESGESFNATLVAFSLDIDSELSFVGDSGATEPKGASERTGVEINSFWQANNWLSLYGTWTWTDAAFKVDEGGGVHVPGASDQTFVFGANALWGNGFSASFKLRYLGDAPLVEDNSIRSEDSLLTLAGVSYRTGALEFTLEAFNPLDSDDADISYYYASRLPGEPSAGVEDIHFRPLEPRSIRASVAWRW